MRRVDCHQCGVKVEAVPWGCGKHQLTTACVLFLAHWARKLSWKETALSFRTSWDKVCQAVEVVLAWGLERRTLGPIQAIGVDEVACGKGHQYLTLVYQIDAHCTRLLWVGKERTVATFEQFFEMIGADRSGKIEFVCPDMWKPYLRVIRARCSNALNILDRFHIVAKMNVALDEVRAGEARRLVQDGFEPVLKKTRWCVLKRKENLTGNQRIRLRDILKYNQQTVRAYLLKEQFAHLWNYDSPTWAGKFLDQWIALAMRSRIEPMKTVAKTLRNHREPILNYFRAKKQFFSGVVEATSTTACQSPKTEPRRRLTAASMALVTSDTMGRKPTARVIGNVIRRERTGVSQPLMRCLPGSRQVRSSASCSSANAVVALTSRSNRPLRWPSSL